MDFNALLAFNDAFVFNSNMLPLDQNFQQFPAVTPQLNPLVRMEDGGGDAGQPYFPNNNNGNFPNNQELISEATFNYTENNGQAEAVRQTPVNNVAESFEDQDLTEDNKEEEFVIHPETVFVSNLIYGVTKFDIQMHFSKVGTIKVDETTGKVKIFVYKNKVTGRSKGEATITYTNANGAQAAINWLNGTRLCGKVIRVMQAYISTNGKGVRFDYVRDLLPTMRRDRKKIWKPAADNWLCRKCQNSNFVWRSSCNRCKANKIEAQLVRRSDGKPVRPWRPLRSDWHCGYCFNANFWYRKKCNRCGSPKEDLESHMQFQHQNDSDENLYARR